MHSRILGFLRTWFVHLLDGLKREYRAADLFTPRSNGRRFSNENSIIGGRFVTIRPGNLTKRPLPEVPMINSFQVTHRENPSNLTIVTIDVLENGSLVVRDWSTGDFADEVYGADVEHNIELAPESVQKLISSLSFTADSKTPESLASYLTQQYKNENLALASIRDLCDQHGVQYQEEFWP